MVNPSYQKSATVADERRKGFKGKNLKQISGAMLRAARADNTQRSYKSARTQFQSWCSSEGIKPLEITGEQLGEYLCWLAVEKEYPPASIRAKLAGIRRWFRDEQGRDNVTVSDHVLQVWSGIQRQFAQRPSQAKALTIDIIREIINVLPDRDGTWSIKAIRDRALMLVGYGCAFRRSELSGLRVDDVEFQEAGVTLFLRKSKTDQHSRGEWIGLGCGTGPTCPVAALRAWLDVAPAGEWVFRGVDRWGHVSPEPLTDHAINLLVRGWVEMLGAQDYEAYSAHSLRAGILTDLVANGVSLPLVMERTRHKSPVMVGTYNRPKSALSTNFSELVKL